MEQVQSPTEENSGSYDHSELVTGASAVCSMLIEENSGSELVIGTSTVCSMLIEGSCDQAEPVIGASTVCSMLIEGSCNQSELVTGASAVCRKIIEENSGSELVTGVSIVCPNDKCPAATATNDETKVERPCQEETSQPWLKSKLVGLHH